MADIAVAGGSPTRAAGGIGDDDIGAGDIGDGVARAALAVARRFAAGATMWCIAPAWPHHARHVAVEFVHPVIVGTRALPAVSVIDPDPVAALRVMARPGDILVGISAASSAPVAAAMRRAPAWGVLSVWLGAGPRPEPGAADHVLWVEDPHGRAGLDGSVVLHYHLLWELTHVCFEHPGLLALDAEGADCPWNGGRVDAGCITCSDEGLLAEVMTTAGTATATVRTAGGQTVIDTTLVGPVGPGDLVLVHAGSAIALLEQADA